MEAETKMYEDEHADDPTRSMSAGALKAYIQSGREGFYHYGLTAALKALDRRVSPAEAERIRRSIKLDYLPTLRLVTGQSRVPDSPEEWESRTTVHFLTGEVDHYTHSREEWVLHDLTLLLAVLREAALREYSNRLSIVTSGLYVVAERGCVSIYNAREAPRGTQRSK